MAIESGVEFSSSQVSYLLTRNILYGFEGWARPPPLTEAAKNVLCSSSDEFHALYGEHYVNGKNTGASLKIIISAEASSTEKKTEVAATLKSTYSNWGMEASTNGSINTQTDSSYSSLNTSYSIVTSGTNRGSGVGSLELEQVAAELLDFPNIAEVGVGISTELRSYNSHPDYVETL
jgi:hypothetical protein